MGTNMRHGFKLKKLGAALPKGGKVKVPKSRESIEIRIRDPDGKTMWHWDPARGNLQQGLYECLDFTGRGLGMSLDEIIIPKEKITQDKLAEINSAARSAVERVTQG